MADTIEKRMADDSLMQRRIEDLKAENERLTNTLLMAVDALKAARFYVKLAVDENGGTERCDLDYWADLVTVDDAIEAINEATND